MEKLSQEDQYQLMKGWLNERQWRLYVPTEARRIGVGGISQVAREAGVTRKTIRTGMKVTDDEMAALHIVRDPFHGEWNYTIQPE